MIELRVNEDPLHTACGICPRQSHLPPKTDSYNNTELTFHSVAPDETNSSALQKHNSHRLYVLPHHVWVFPVWRHQTIDRLGLVVFPKCDTETWTGLEWTAAGVSCILCLPREEKFANGTDTGSRQWETCSWPEINTVAGTISASHTTSGCRCEASETWCGLQTSPVMLG